MNKSDLIETIIQKTNVGKKQAESAVNLVFDSMVEAMSKGDRIELRGFGSFAVRNYKAYTGRNPRTGALIEVKPKKLPFFKVGKELREKVNLQDSGVSPAGFPLSRE